MTWPDVFKKIMLPGALAGLLGGLVFGAAMIQLGMLPTVASLVHTDSDIAGFIIHIILAAILGAGFSLLVWPQRGGAGEMLFWGLIYGTLWWLVGPLTLLPLLVGQGLMWDIHAVQTAFPSLPGHLWYGASMAITLTLLQRVWPVAVSGSPSDSTSRLPKSQLTTGALVRGALAGLLAAWLLGAMLAAQDQLLVHRGLNKLVVTHHPSTSSGCGLATNSCQTSILSLSKDTAYLSSYLRPSVLARRLPKSRRLRMWGYMRGKKRDHPQGQRRSWPSHSAAWG